MKSIFEHSYIDTTKEKVELGPYDTGVEDVNIVIYEYITFTKRTWEEHMKKMIKAANRIRKWYVSRRLFIENLIESFGSGFSDPVVRVTKRTLIRYFIVFCMSDPSSLERPAYLIWYFSRRFPIPDKITVRVIIELLGYLSIDDILRIF